jgi:hypothetical protein
MKSEQVLGPRVSNQREERALVGRGDVKAKMLTQQFEASIYKGLVVSYP